MYNAAIQHSSVFAKFPHETQSMDMLSPDRTGFLQSRIWQQRAVTGLILLAAGLMLLGIGALRTAPILIHESGIKLPFVESNTTSMDELTLEPGFFLRLPEFFAATAETRWWKLQEQAHALLRTRDVVRLTLAEKDGRSTQQQFQVGFSSLREVVASTWIVYLVALVYLGSALLVFRRHRSPPGSVLTFFFLACALYFVCSAPVVSRPVTLHPLAFKILIAFLQASAGGLITLAHFALIFPTPKRILTRYPWFPFFLYGYFGLAVLLYHARMTAFGTTFPLFCVWIVVIIGAFLHSLLTEGDPFLKKQIGLSLTAPIFASLFAIFYLLPGVLGMPPMPLTYFALLSLIIPYALPLAMDIHVLYHERLAAEQQKRETERRAQAEKTRLQDNLHDIVLHNLAVISHTAEVALTRLDRDPASVRERLQATQDLAIETSRQLREFLWVIDERHNTWDEFCSYLHGWGLQVVEGLDLAFELDISPAVLTLPPPSPQLRVCLYMVYREAIINALKHAHATRIQGTIGRSEEAVRCEIQDNGMGFDPGVEKPGHYGLQHMQKSVHALGGTVSISTGARAGTRIIFSLPWRENTSIAGETPA